MQPPRRPVGQAPERRRYRAGRCSIVRMAVASAVVSDALLAACRRGEEAAQLQLYNQLAYSLMGVCLRYCPSRPEAEDALQNTFVKIFTRLDQYRGDGPFEAWARRIAVHTSLHAVEQHRLRHPTSAGAADLDGPAAHLPSADPRPSTSSPPPTCSGTWRPYPPATAPCSTSTLSKATRTSK